MELRHFAHEPVMEFDREYAYPKLERPSTYSKPVGFWFSNEDSADGWKTWCASENFYSERLENEHVVELAEDATILYLRTVEEMRAFQVKYGRQIDPHDFYRTLSAPYTIMWDLVALDYQGIVIPRYMYEARWGMEWYYTWDVASGCVWDLSAIKSVEPVKKLEKA